MTVVGVEDDWTWTCSRCATTYTSGWDDETEQDTDLPGSQTVFDDGTLVIVCESCTRSVGIENADEAAELAQTIAEATHTSDRG